jgi:hypothetical protein
VEKFAARADAKAQETKRHRVHNAETEWVKVSDGGMQFGEGRTTGCLQTAWEAHQPCTAHAPCSIQRRPMPCIGLLGGAHAQCAAGPRRSLYITHAHMPMHAPLVMVEHHQRWRRWATTRQMPPHDGPAMEAGSGSYQLRIILNY